MTAQGGHGHRRWRLSGHKKPHIDTVRNDINVTPLVDVMLVLLIIFMLMTLLMGRGHDVSLPRAQNYSQQKDKQQPVVSVDEKLILWVEKNKIGPIDTKQNQEATFKEMDQQVQALWTKKTEGAGQVYVKADERLTFVDIYPVLLHIARGSTPPAISDLKVNAIDLAIAKGEAK